MTGMLQETKHCSTCMLPSIVAETASIFGELLLTDSLLKGAKTDNRTQSTVCLILDEAGMTTFQVTARVWFEQALYTSIEQGEFLDYPTICNLWIKARDRIYGNSITWLPEMNAEWTMKPHYFMANYRFYNYPYVYAQMFVYALYERYLEEGKAFVPKLVKALIGWRQLVPTTNWQNRWIRCSCTRLLEWKLEGL